jgi:hypothetical protein
MGGDWGRKRAVLTPHERGIPEALLLRWLTENGLHITTQSFVLFPPIGRLWRLTGHPQHNSRLLTALDRRICRVLRPSLRYHATNGLQNLRSTNIAVVVRKS